MLPTIKTNDIEIKDPLTEYKDFYIAQYNSLRGEINKRIAHQTTLNQASIAAFGVILSYGLEKISTNSFNSVYLILVYPLLAYFISFAWSFNHIRICQIANYLKRFEKEVTPHLEQFGWETHVYEMDKKNRELSYSSNNGFFSRLKETLTNTNKVRPGITILAGTQMVALAVALGLLGSHLPYGDIFSVETIAGWLFFIVDLGVARLTYLTLKKQGYDGDNVGSNSKLCEN